MWGTCKVVYRQKSPSQIEPEKCRTSIDKSVDFKEEDSQVDNTPTYTYNHILIKATF